MLAGVTFAALAAWEPSAAEPASGTEVSARITGIAAWIALAGFVTASVTDALDGYLARRWDAVSTFGRIADPLADKILVLGTLVMLAGPNLNTVSGVEAWMVVVILTRELLVTALRGYYEARGLDFSAGLAGKAKMIAQAAGLGLILFAVSMERYVSAPGLETLATVTAWVITIVTAWSAWPYLERAIKAEREAAQ